MIEQLFLEHSYWMYAFMGLFYLAIGSLLNVIIHRLPLMLQRQWQQHCCELLRIQDRPSEVPLNLFFPRSFCPQCKSTVKAWHNIPLFSYLLLKGRCQQCQARISLRYPLVELLTLILSLYASWNFGFTVVLVFALLAIYLLICLFFIDLEHQLLPDSLTLSLLWLGLIANTQNGFTSSTQDAVFAAVGGYLSLWLMIQLYYSITGRIGMGHGDFKLFAALGAWFGWTLLPFILLISSLSAILVGSVYLRLKKQPMDTRISFGPFLCISGLICLFWGLPLSLLIGKLQLV